MARLTFTLLILLWSFSLTLAESGAKTEASEEAEPHDRSHPTWAKDIAPILFNHCASCHHPGGAGPFSLLDYAAAEKRANQIAGVTSSGYMPPWLPSSTERFKDARALTAEQIQTLKEWANTGANEGDESIAPPVPTFSKTWKLGSPDLVLSLKQAYELPATGADIYRNFVLSHDLDQPRFVRAIEFIPDNPKLVHHARFAIDPTASSRALDQLDPAPGFEGMDLGVADNPDGHLLGWAPGRTAKPFGNGMAWTLHPTADVVAQLHMVPSGKKEPVNFKLGLYFTDTPPSKRPVSIVLGSREIDISPGINDYQVQDQYVLPVDASLLALVPHAHYLGQTMHVRATPPNSKTRTLLMIEDWDFNWQDEYHYATPLELPAGTIVEMIYTFDNSSENPQNPFNPPKRIRQGPQTTDEMAELALQFLPSDPKSVARMEADAGLQNARKAIRFRQERVRQFPNETESWLALGSAWLELGKPSEAVSPLRRAARLQPNSPKILNNLGYALEQSQQRDEALKFYRRALTLDPNFIEAHQNLARLLRGQGQWTTAISHLEYLVEHGPESHYAKMDLAWILATHPNRKLANPTRAEALATEALAQLPADDPILFATLAAAQAAQSQFEAAIKSLDRALALNPEGLPQSLTQALMDQRALYLDKQPYIQENVR